MDAPLTSQKWHSYLRDFAQNREKLIHYDASIKLEYMNQHIPAIFRTVIASKGAEIYLKAILAKFISDKTLQPVCIEIAKKIASLNSNYIPKSDVHIDKPHGLRAFRIRWDEFMSLPFLAKDYIKNNLYHDILYYYEREPEIVLDELFERMTTYFEEGPWDSAKIDLAQDTLELLGNLLAMRDLTTPQYDKLVNALLLSKHAAGCKFSVSAEVWMKMSFEKISIQQLFKTLSDHILIIGPLVRTNAEFREKLSESFNKFYYTEFDHASPAIIKDFVHLCSSLNKIDPTFLPHHIKLLATEKMSVSLKKGTSSVRRYKFLILKKSAKNIENLEKSNINPRLFAKALDSLYGYQKSGETTRKPLTLEELIELYSFSDEVGEKDLHLEIFNKLHSIVDEMKESLPLQASDVFEKMLRHNNDRYSFSQLYTGTDLRIIYQKLHKNYVEYFQNVDLAKDGHDIKYMAYHIPEGRIFESFAHWLREIQFERAERNIDEFYSMIKMIQAVHIVSNRKKEDKQYRLVGQLILCALSNPDKETCRNELMMIRSSFPEINYKVEIDKLEDNDLDEFSIIEKQKLVLETDEGTSLAIELTQSGVNTDPALLHLLLSYIDPE